MQPRFALQGQGVHPSYLCCCHSQRPAPPASLLAGRTASVHTQRWGPATGLQAHSKAELINLAAGYEAVYVCMAPYV